MTIMESFGYAVLYAPLLFSFITLAIVSKCADSDVDSDGESTSESIKVFQFKYHSTRDDIIQPKITTPDLMGYLMRDLKPNTIGFSHRKMYLIVDESSYTRYNQNAAKIASRVATLATPLGYQFAYQRQNTIPEVDLPSCLDYIKFATSNQQEEGPRRMTLLLAKQPNLLKTQVDADSLPSDYNIVADRTLEFRNL